MLSHNRTVLSSLALAMTWPAREYATVSMVPACAVMACTTRPDVVSQMTRCPPQSPAATRDPSGEKPAAVGQVVRPSSRRIGVLLPTFQRKTDAGDSLIGEPPPLTKYWLSGAHSTKVGQ